MATPTTPFTPLQTQKWELGVSLILTFWQPLRDAVSSSWGGPDSSDKRDWLCGVIADMWDEDPEASEDTVEYRLLQVMEDEFEVGLEDDSAFEVARQVVMLRKEVVEGMFATVDMLHQRFLAMAGNSPKPPKVEEDEEMGDAPTAAAAAAERERVERVVDEDGFELVQKGRRR
ncbi:Pre-rRNA-processing protein TSR2-domain-containing protein [Trichophaea hybrida]|nr:Pre-rRNA-processing protein TSR2-domain-containing protein [Trichophaea hybrida]